MNATSRESTDALRDLVDAVESGLLALDAGGTIVDANLAAAALLGRRRNHLTGKPLAALIPLQSRRAFRTALAALPRARTRALSVELGDPPARYALTLSIVPGSLPLRLTATLARTDEEPPPLPPPPQPRDDGDAVRLLLDRFPHAIVAVDAELRVTFANWRARALLGRHAAAVGQPLPEPWPGVELRPLADQLVRGAQLTAHALELRDGRVFQLSGGGSTRGGGSAVLLLEDATDRVRSERVMHEFVRNAAHQLRTPLTGIATAVEVLQSGAKELPRDRDHFLANIERDTHRLTRLARALLVLARAQAGTQVPRLEFVELRPLLEELLADARPQTGVETVLQCEGGLAALAEPDLLREALAALLDNAVAHTLVGEIRVEVADADRFVAVDVRDTGGGIPPREREKLFDPFYGNGHDPDRFGLGLAIAQQAVAAMDGQLLVDSTPGVGSVFRIRLPSAKVVGR